MLCECTCGACLSIVPIVTTREKKKYCLRCILIDICVNVAVKSQMGIDTKDFVINEVLFFAPQIENSIEMLEMFQ